LHPGAHGGTVTAVDDHATDLIDPQPATQLRTVAPVADEAATALAVPDDAPAGPPKRPRKNRATIPSWEDVLLGVRSPNP
jgi:hypothetical protein